MQTQFASTTETLQDPPRGGHAHLRPACHKCRVAAVARSLTRSPSLSHSHTHALTLTE